MYVHGLVILDMGWSILDGRTQKTSKTGYVKMGNSFFGSFVINWGQVLPKKSKKPVKK